MEIMELAAELGKKIKEDERVKRFEAADAKFDSDSELQQLIEEYRTQRALLDAEEEKDESDKASTAIIEARIEELYQKVMDHPIYSEYSDAKEELDALMHDVNDEITFQITGERPCTHDCSTCGGCH